MTSNSLADSLAAAIVRATDYHRLSGAAAAGAGQWSRYTIAISREPGAKGTAVARELGQRLGWPVYDEELLNLISKEMGTQVDMLKLIDEKPVSFLEQSVISMVSEYNLNQDSYMVHLVATVRALGEKGACILVGRGASFIVPPATTLRVRLVADLPDRIAVIQKLKGLNEKEAAHWIDKTMHQRHLFIKKNFGKDLMHPHHYDLLLNTSRWSAAAAAELIVDALHRLEVHR
jgi:cytidylate kinase